MISQPLVRLDSSDPQQRDWQIAPTQSHWRLRADSGAGAALFADGQLRHQWDDPLEALAWLAKPNSDREPTGPGEHGKWVGFLSYDLGRRFEQLPELACDDLHLPLFAFVFCEGSECRTKKLAWEDPADSASSEIVTQLRSTFTPDEYRNAVRRVIEYIRAGDVFQVNLSQRFTARQSASPATIYQRLIDHAPAAYGALLNFGDFALLCNSPELFLRVTPGAGTALRRIVTRPIKGTRPRMPGMDIILRDSIKDQAELNMIIDLERNDLGRICKIGSVKVTQPRTIEAHPTVYHGVATVEGQLRPDVTFIDILRAVFPGGSITGAPKIRAMQIIEELEPVRRGPYCGAIGCIATDGSMQFNVAIRTMIVKDCLVHIPVGGGIVADSDPAAEYEETLVKAKAMFRALGVSADE